jgi:biopolymer transport protein ExbD
MAIGKFEHSGVGEPLSEINTTPLVDVMLVLLVIFIITAPLLTQGIALDLPKADAKVVQASPQTLNVSIKANGDYYLDKRKVTKSELENALSQASEKFKQTPVHLRADRETKYESVIDVMELANKFGLTQIAFVTEQARAK